MAEFTLIDLAGWPRRTFFEHYLHEIPCTYSLTTNIDITHIRKQHLRLYPALLYALTRTVNQFPQFRTALDSEGHPGIFSEMLPCYTVFQPETETFTNLWTEVTGSYSDFAAAYERDLTEYGAVLSIEGKPNTPPNIFPVSMVPWESFTGFNLNLPKGSTYLLPIFTFGRFMEQDGHTLIPLSVQVHHAVCDGFHVCHFLKQLREEINDL